MRISHAAILFLTISSTAPVCSAQSAGSQQHPVAVASTLASTPTAPSAPVAPSTILGPSLDGLKKTVSAVSVDHWKKGTVRDEAERNLGAIQHDLVEILPGLLKDADAAPATLSKALPVSRNVDALYDVLVHVVEGSRVSAPGEQVAQLQQAMDALEKARLALGNQMQDQAVAQEQQIGSMRTAFQAQSSSLHVLQAALGVPACPAAPVVKKPHPKRVAPVAGTPAGTTAKPSASGTTPTKPATGTAPPKPQ